MPIFDGINPNGGSATIEQAITAVVGQARRRGLSPASTSWSIAELRPDQDDFDWLCSWAVQLDAGTLRHWLRNSWSAFHTEEGQRVPNQAGLGLLLIMLAAEAARREATEGTLWRYVQHDRSNRPRFRVETDGELFIPGGDRTRAFKDAMEAAAGHFRLRNVFDETEGMRYYVTVFLQFGFTIRDARKRLPLWLGSQGIQKAIDHLLSDGPLGSPSFRRLWDCLRYYRSRNLGREQAVRLLAESPWILPDWAEELLGLAQLMPIGESSGPDEDMPFLSPPALSWTPPGEPRFTCRVVNLALLDLSEEEYDLRIAGETLVRLIRQGDEQYLAVPSDAIILPVFAPTVAASLVARDGSVVRSATLMCWAPNEDVSAFRLPGGERLRPEEPLRASGEYAILHSPDQALEPAPPWWNIMEGPQPTQVSFLARENVLTARFQADGESFWSLAEGVHGGPPEPPWAVPVVLSLRDVQDDRMAMGGAFFVTVHHPADVEVGFVRFRMRPVSFAVEAMDRTVAGPMVLSPELIHYPEITRADGDGEPRKIGTGGTLEFTVGLRRGSVTARIRRVLRIDGQGAAQLHAVAWTVLSEASSLSVEEGRTDQFKIVPPWQERGRTVAFEEWAIMEGNTWVGRPSRLPRPIENLAGLGAKLTIRRGPFNAMGDAVVMAGEVVHRGLLRDVVLIPQTEGRPRSLRLELERAVEVDHEYDVIWWDWSGQVTYLRPEAYRDGETTRLDWWTVDLPETLLEPRAVAITYAHYRRGLWWPWNWSDGLVDLGEGDPRTLAVLLRWLRLPILGRGALRIVREFTDAHPVEVLGAWLLDAEAPESYRWHLADEGWLSAVWEVFRSWHPRPVDVEALIRETGTRQCDDHPLVCLALELQRLSPLIMGKVLWCWLYECRALVSEPNSAKALLRFLRLKIAGLGPARIQDYAQARTDLMNRCCDQIGKIDVYFVESLLKAAIDDLVRRKKLDSFEAANLDVIIGRVEDFRRLLALRILDAIGPQ